MYAKKEQNTETDNSNFGVGFLEFLQKDKQEEDNSSQELDNFGHLKILLTQRFPDSFSVHDILCKLRRESFQNSEKFEIFIT